MEGTRRIWSFLVRYGPDWIVGLDRPSRTFCHARGGPFRLCDLIGHPTGTPLGARIGVWLDQHDVPGLAAITAAGQALLLDYY